MIYKNKLKKYKKGFTLIELIISIGLFLVVVLIGLGSIASIYNNNKKAQNLTSVTNDLNYAIESMSRDIRFAKTLHCGTAGDLTVENSCPLGDTSISVSTTTGSWVTYEFIGSVLRVRENGGSPASLAPGTTIEYARFYIFNTVPFSSSPTAGYDAQPYALIVIKGYAGTNPSNETRFTIQTVVSKRQLDL